MPLGESGNVQAQGNKELIKPLGRYATIIQAELIGIEDPAQLCSDSIAAFTAVYNMILKPSRTMESYNTINSRVKHQAVELL